MIRATPQEPMNQIYGDDDWSTCFWLFFSTHRLVGVRVVYDLAAIVLQDETTALTLVAIDFSSFGRGAPLDDRQPHKRFRRQGSCL